MVVDKKMGQSLIKFTHFKNVYVLGIKACVSLMHDLTPFLYHGIILVQCRLGLENGILE